MSSITLPSGLPFRADTPACFTPWVLATVLRIHRPYPRIAVSYTSAQRRVLCSWMAPPGLELDVLLGDLGMAVLTGLGVPAHERTDDLATRTSAAIRARAGLPANGVDVAYSVMESLIEDTEHRDLGIGRGPFRLALSGRLLIVDPSIAQREFETRYRSLQTGDCQIPVSPLFRWSPAFLASPPCVADTRFDTLRTAYQAEATSRSAQRVPA